MAFAKSDGAQRNLKNTPLMTCKNKAISPIYPAIGEGNGFCLGYDWVEKGVLAMTGGKRSRGGRRAMTEEKEPVTVSLNGKAAFLALTAGLYWTWWDSFHEISRFSNRFFGDQEPFSLFGVDILYTDVYLSCIVKPLGVVLGCAAVGLFVRRSRSVMISTPKKACFAAIGVEVLLHFAYYGLLQLGLRECAFGLYGLISAVFVVLLVQTALQIRGLGERRIVSVIMGALLIYGLVNNLLFPFALLDAAVPIIATVYAVVLLCAVACWLLGGEAEALLTEERVCGARTPLPLMAHLVIYGAVFGVLHVLGGFIQPGPFSINVGVFFGCVMTVALLALLFFAMGSNRELWSKMRSTVFPLAIVGYLLIPLASNSDLALAFTEAGHLLYVAFLFLGCFSLMRQTCADPRIIVAKALIFYNLGSAAGVVFAVNFETSFAPGTQNYFALSVAVTALLTAATFWVGTDEQIRKIWGLRRKLSAKHYNDLVTKARVRKLTAECDLTPRESDILLLIAQGRRAPEMTDALGVSMGTVRTHVKHLYAKLDVHSYAEAVRALEEVSLDEGELQE